MSIKVRAVDAQGHEGPIREISGKTTNGCTAIALKHGNTVPCEVGGGTCYYLAMNYSGVPAGNYTVCFHFDNATPECWRDYPGQNLSGNGSWSTQSAVGARGGHYGNNQNTNGWVEIRGANTYRSPTINWKNEG